jgi:hypothetical protein
MLRPYENDSLREANTDKLHCAQLLKYAIELVTKTLKVKSPGYASYQFRCINLSSP